MAEVKRSPNRTANCGLAMAHSRGRFTPARSSSRPGRGAWLPPHCWETAPAPNRPAQHCIERFDGICHIQNPPRRGRQERGRFRPRRVAGSDRQPGICGPTGSKAPSAASASTVRLLFFSAAATGLRFFQATKSRLWHGASSSS
jgi:hypothetical protein